MGDNYALYKAIQSYTPPASERKTLEFKKDDVFEICVPSPFSTNEPERPGWLYAYNRRTGAEGYVPVEKVELLGSKLNNTVHHPSALGVEASGIYCSKTDCGKAENEHSLEPIFVVTPLFCRKCE